MDLGRVVWVVERNHQQHIVDGRVICFPCGGDGTHAVISYIESMRRVDDAHYDAAIYERKGA